MSHKESIPPGPYIERCPHDKENPYAQTSRALIRDQDLPPSVAWMLIYLLSMPDNWSINVKQIYTQVKGHKYCGRDMVYQWIDKAIEVGYMKKVEWKEGNLNRCKYWLSETPKFKKSFPHPGSQEAGETDPERQGIKKELIKEEESSLAVAKESASRTARATHVSTSSKEHEELIKEFGKEMTQAAYEKLSEWKEDTPKSKWKKNDHLAIRRWVVDSIKEKALKASKDPENRIKEMQGYILSHPKKESLISAKKKGMLDWGEKWIDFKAGPDSFIYFDNPKAKVMIDHYIRKIGI